MIMYKYEFGVFLMRQHLFLYFLPEIDKDAMRLLFPYTLDALDAYALMRMVKTIVPVHMACLGCCQRAGYSLKVV
jgi:hypothetical protein